MDDTRTRWQVYEIVLATGEHRYCGRQTAPEHALAEARTKLSWPFISPRRGGDDLDGAGVLARLVAGHTLTVYCRDGETLTVAPVTR